MNGLDELYCDICEAEDYFREAVLEASAIIEESEPELAGALTEQKSHFQTALAAMWIVKTCCMKKMRRPGCGNT